MATVTPEPTDVPEAEPHEAGEGHSHPSDWLYVKVAIALALLTAFEVFTYFESVHGWSDGALIALLTIMMFVKFLLVVAFFMHLKFDSPLFWRLFVFGLILAMAVYMVMLTAFRFW